MCKRNFQLSAFYPIRRQAIMLPLAPFILQQQLHFCYSTVAASVGLCKRALAIDLVLRID